MRFARSGSIAFVVVTAAGIVSCGGGSSGGPTGGNTLAIAMTASASGDGQSAQVGTALPLPLRVLVTLNGVADAGATVAWAASGTGASVNPTQSTTDATGIATTTWTLGTTAGPEAATATVSGATGSPVTFTAIATPVPVPLIQKAPSGSGDGQADTVEGTLPNPLKVLVTLTGSPQAGDTVTWTAANPGGAVTPRFSVTDATGIAATSWTLGSAAGAQSATATLAGASGSPVTFSATASAGAATQLSLVSGNNQTGTVNSALASPLKVLVGDRFANGVAGDTVQWQVTSGTATLGGATSVSGTNGVAQMTVTLGATPGPVGISATRSGLTGSPVSFAATATLAPMADTVHVGDDFFQSLRNGTQNPAVDTVAAGGTVTWIWVGTLDHSVQSTGATSFTSSVIQATGKYTFTFTPPGTYTYDCAVHGAAMTGEVVVR